MQQQKMHFLNYFLNYMCYNYYHNLIIPHTCMLSYLFNSNKNVSNNVDSLFCNPLDFFACEKYFLKDLAREKGRYSRIVKTKLLSNLFFQIIIDLFSPPSALKAVET